MISAINGPVCQASWDTCKQCILLVAGHDILQFSDKTKGLLWYALTGSVHAELTGR